MFRINYIFAGDILSTIYSYFIVHIFKIQICARIKKETFMSEDLRQICFKVYKHQTALHHKKKPHTSK